MLQWISFFHSKLLFYWKRRGIEKIHDGDRVWFISDTHFGHKNILSFGRYETFYSIRHMNVTLVKNWNQVVRPRDRIYFVGDFGKLTYRYRRRLHGNKKYVKGNHDRITWPRQRMVTYRGLVFLLIHDPNDHTCWFFGDWIIHGHTHKNTPFIDIHRRRINVSCDVINYTPISFAEIYRQIHIAEMAHGNIQYKMN